MLWVVILVAVCSVFVVCFLVTYAILRWRFGDVCSMSKLICLKDKHEIYKYVVTPSRGHDRELSNGVPCIKAKPINVQPTSENLDLRLFMMSTKIASNNNNNTDATNILISPETFQTPLISYYESNNNGGLSRRRSTKSSLEQSYAQNPMAVTDTVGIVATPDTSANISKYEPCAEPELSFSIFYDAPSKDLHVTVLHAASLPVPESLQGTKCTVYVRVKVRVEPWETQWRETRHVSGTRESNFGETFIISGLVHHKLRECTVHFMVVSYEEHQNCWRVVGELCQSLIECRANQLMKVTKKLYQTLINTAGNK